jgi:hypothetical protein
MKKKINFKGYQGGNEINGEKIGELFRVVDFLPSPSRLAKREKKVKISLNVSRGSFDFYRYAAFKTGVGYQKLMRAALDAYAQAHDKKI